MPQFWFELEELEDSLELLEQLEHDSLDPLASDVPWLESPPQPELGSVSGGGPS